jgi:hypothetical protein
MRYPLAGVSSEQPQGMLKAPADEAVPRRLQAKAAVRPESGTSQQLVDPCVSACARKGLQAGEKLRTLASVRRSGYVGEVRRRDSADFGFARPVGRAGDFAADLVRRGDFAADVVRRFADPRSCLAF